MESSKIHVDVTLCLTTRLSQSDTQQLLQNLSAVDGISCMRFADASGRLLRVSFDPYWISARDILKWLAQHTIKADLLNATDLRGEPRMHLLTDPPEPKERDA